MPEMLIIGGPNGAGKTTAARSLFRERIGMREFVNADEIARGLSPFYPEGAAIAAGRLMLERMTDLVKRRESFIVETTCAGRSNLNFARQLKGEGWDLGLVYLWLRSPSVAIRRVARRVSEGGHSIPRDAIVRRYWSGLNNVRRHYLPLVDFLNIRDNTDGNPVLIAEKSDGGQIAVYDEKRWQEFLESTE
jgi:predicted ABC-type ATPase